MLSTEDGGPFQEYFYIQIPVLNTTETDDRKYRKFFYVPSGSGKFPLSFGLEVAAQAIGRPERSNWKNCALDESEEARLAEAFKADFAPYDFTNSS